MIVMLYSFEEVTSFLYIDVFSAWVFFFIICLVISTIIKNLLESLQKNKELIETIKSILEVLPESIIIQQFDSQLEKNIIKFTNYKAQNKILNCNGVCRKFCNSELFNFKIKESDLQELKQSEEMKEVPDISIINILNIHQQKLINQMNDNEVSSTIETTPITNEIEQPVVINESIFYLISSVKVKWIFNQLAFMHIFTDISSVK